MWKKAPGILPTEPGYFFVKNHLKNGNRGRDAANFTSAGWNIGIYTLELTHELEWYDESEPSFSAKDIQNAMETGSIIGLTQKTEEAIEDVIKIRLEKDYKIFL